MKILFTICAFSVVLSGCGLSIVSKADKEFLKAVKKIQTAGDCATKITEIPECQETAENAKDLVK